MNKTDKKKNRFANVIIILCIAVSMVVTAAVIYEYHRLDTVIPSSVLASLFGFWGGELLIIAIRQIFGSDVTKNIKTYKNDHIIVTDDEIGGI